jgi:hypothetical protein
MGGIQELTGFQEHFHHMLIDMPPCSLSRIGMESKDIHLVAFYILILYFNFLLVLI